MDEPISIAVSPHQGRIRLDRYLVCQDLKLSRSQIQRLIGQGLISVNGRTAGASYQVKPGDAIAVSGNRPAWDPKRMPAQDLPLSIVFEDEHFLVVDKPAGMVVHPAPGNRDRTLVNALLHHVRTLSAVGGRERPGIVHRLDKDTSGLLVVARTDGAHRSLAAQLEARLMRRIYRAVTWGRLSPPRGEIDAPIGRSTFDRKKMAVTALSGRAAQTGFSVLEEFNIACLAELRLRTGRTHQIRVHLQHLGHPIVGDPWYGGRSRQCVARFAKGRPELSEGMLTIMQRPALHACRLLLKHPATGADMEFESPLPGDMTALLDLLRRADRTPGSPNAVSATISLDKKKRN